MNRSTQGSSRKKVSILLSKATDGFLKFKLAEGLSNRTITSYEYYLNQWIAHVGNIDAAKVTASDISKHLAWLRTEYKPRRWNGKTEPLSPKTIRNAYIALRSFYAWLNIEFGIPTPFVHLTPPKYQKQVIEVFTKEEIELLLKACVYARESNPHDRKSFVTRRPSANRDKAFL